MAKVTEIHITNNPPEPSATNLVDTMSLHIPLAGAIDPEAECARLQKEKKKLETIIARISAKLSNQKFLDNAPPQVIKKEKEKLAEAQVMQDKINMQFETFALQ